jgi:hypothetical protein
VGGIPGAVLAVPVAAAIELIIEDLQAREQPVAQDPTVGEPEDASVTVAPDAPSDARDPVVSTGKSARGAAAESSG